jgi:hypothetical protein
MPRQCYREVNGEQRKGVRATRKSGGGYCKLIPKTKATGRKERKDIGIRRDLGTQVGKRYGKVIYRSTKGAFFYYGTAGKKVYLSANAVKEAGFYAHQKRSTNVTSTSTYLRNNTAPTKSGSVEPKKVRASGEIVDRDEMPDPAENFQVTMAPQRVKKSVTLHPKPYPRNNHAQKYIDTRHEVEQKMGWEYTKEAIDIFTERLNGATVERLKTECQRYGVKTTGKKADLIKRIINELLKVMDPVGGDDFHRIKVLRSKASHENGSLY